MCGIVVVVVVVVVGLEWCVLVRTNMKRKEEKRVKEHKKRVNGDR